MPVSNISTANVSAAAEMAASADPFFMEFGSSVSVNEDLYREIHNEVRQLEAFTHKTQHEIKGETRTQAHIAKDYAHATNEMKNLSRSTSEAVDEATMNEETRIQLVEQFRTGLLNYIKPEYDDNVDKMNMLGNDGFSQINNAGSLDEKSNEVGNAREGKMHENADAVADQQLALSEVVSRTKKEMQNALSISQRLRTRIDEIATERAEIEKETSLVRQRLAPGSEFVKQLEEAKLERNARQIECQSEEKRVASMKEACHDARTKCTEYATALVEEDRKFDQKKKEYQEADGALVTKIHETKTEIEALDNGEISEWKAKKEESDAAVAKLESQLTLIEELKSKISSITANREEIAKQMETAKVEEAAAMDEKKKAETELSKSQERLKVAQAVEVEAQALRGKNDEQERNRPLQSLKDDIASYAREGERIAARTVEAHAQNEETERQLAKEKMDHEKEISDMEAELKMIQDERDALALKHQKIKDKQKEIRIGVDAEVKSCNATAGKLREAIKNQEQQNVEFAQEIEEEKQAKVEELKARLALEKRQAEFKLKVVKAGSKILEDTEEELQMLQNPIDENALKLENDDLDENSKN